MLVMRDLAFYNPSNTAKDPVVPFSCHPGTQSPKAKVAKLANECLNIDSHFRISQEH
jgi:hypothetical protein